MLPITIAYFSVQLMLYWCYIDVAEVTDVWWFQRFMLGTPGTSGNIAAWWTSVLGETGSKAYYSRTSSSCELEADHIVGVS